jgi:hypothetical protein
MVSNCLGLGLTVPVVQRKPRKRDMSFGTLIERSLCRLGSITIVATELARYTLDLLGVEVRWDKGAMVRAGDYNIFYGRGNENHQFGTGFFVHHRILSAVKRVESIGDRMSYTVLRGCWFSHCFECACIN